MFRNSMITALACLLAVALATPPALAQGEEQAPPAVEGDAGPERGPEADAEGDDAKGGALECGECGEAPVGGHVPKSLTGAITLLAGVAVVVLSGFSLFAFLLLIAIAFPTTVANVRTGMENRPIFSFVLGLGNVVFALLLVGALANGGGPGGVLGGIIFLAFMMVMILGLSGRAQHLGSRAMALAERKPNTVANLAIGWWVLYLVGIIPIVGWILFAYWATSGIGAVLVSLFGRSRPVSTGSQDGGLIIDKPDYTV